MKKTKHLALFDNHADSISTPPPKKNARQFYYWKWNNFELTLFVTKTKKKIQTNKKQNKTKTMKTRKNCFRYLKLMSPLMRPSVQQ